MKTEQCRKIEFTGEFNCDGVSGGDTYSYWLVSEETYKKIIKDTKYAEMEESMYKLYLHQLFSCREEGFKQKVSIRIVNK